MRASNDNHGSEREMIYSLAERFLPSAYTNSETKQIRIPRTHAIMALLIICTTILSGYAVSRVGTYNIDNSVENFVDNSVVSTVDNSVQNISVIGHRYVKELRKWAELSHNEKVAIKAEALAVFPEIKKLGSGVDWRPVSKWLAEEKGVIHSNPRDLFRDRPDEVRRMKAAKRGSAA